MIKQDLTMIELFSGIGAQKRGIENTGLYNLNVIATSDIDKEALVSYAAIHHNLTNEMVNNYDKYPSREQMVEDLKDRNIGMDFDKNKMFDWNKLIKKKTKDLEKYWLAMQLQNNLGDISKIDQLPTADCWFYSSPCQCFSIAGKQDGIDATCNNCGQKYNPMLLDVEHRYVCPNCGSDDIKGTRSGLLLEVERLLIKSIETNTAPKYLCLENVKNLVGKQFKPDFDAWIKRLEHLGYNTYWQILNAKHTGIPQNRERVFAFSIRKDVDTEKYTFPLPFDNGLRLKDILEKEVDEKYFINTEKAKNLIKQLVDKGQLKGQRECCDSSINDPNVKDISNAIIARYDASIQNQKSTGLAVAEPVLDSSKRLGGLWDGEKCTHQAGSVWDSNGMSPTLDTAQGGGRMPHVVEENSKLIKNTEKEVIGIRQATKKGYIECELPGCADLSYPSSTTRRGRVQDNGQTSPTITATETGVHYIENIYRIRKLTPRECFVLMGFKFEDWDKCVDIGISNSAGYKAAGNSIVTNCISLLFEHLYKAQYDESYICTDENFQKPQVD